MKIRILNAWNNQVEFDTEIAVSSTFAQVGNNYDAFKALERELNSINTMAIDKWKSKYDSNSFTPSFWLFHDNKLAVYSEGLPLCSIV
jgi:hypothetical protein